MDDDSEISLPIRVERKAWDNKLVNDWNGTLQIDTNTNSVFANVMGAGIKNENNQFSGVIFGELKESGTKPGITGIYGLKNNQITYKLTDDGNFYVGNKDNDYLSFDGSSFLLSTKKLIVNANNFKIDSTATGDSIVL
jgi:hypothetical protein